MINTLRYVKNVEPIVSGRELCRLMRQHRVTIRDLSKRMGITMKMIREKRMSGIYLPNSARDWIQAITGNDPGPLTQRTP